MEQYGLVFIEVLISEILDEVWHNLILLIFGCYWTALTPLSLWFLVFGHLLCAHANVVYMHHHHFISNNLEGLVKTKPNKEASKEIQLDLLLVAAVSTTSSTLMQLKYVIIHSFIHLVLVFAWAVITDLDSFFSDGFQHNNQSLLNVAIIKAILAIRKLAGIVIILLSVHLLIFFFYFINKKSILQRTNLFVQLGSIKDAGQWK